jgi:hypothetical protein
MMRKIVLFFFIFFQASYFFLLNYHNQLMPESFTALQTLFPTLDFRIMEELMVLILLEPLLSPLRPHEPHIYHQT